MEGSKESWSKKKSLADGRNFRLPDYHEYSMTKQEWLSGVLAGMGVTVFLAYLFYRSLYAVIFLCPVVPFFVKAQKKRLCRRQKETLKMQFKDALQAVSAALQVGYSMENAIVEALHDMERMYGEEGLITREFAAITGGIRNHRTTEELFLQLAQRSGLEDIRDFAEVFAIAKRGGGDLPCVIRVCSVTIGDKIETAKEIQTLIAAKKLEGRIMDIIPCFIILYIDLSSPGFFDVLYYTLFGRVIMTACLAVYLGAILLSEKIMSIEV